MRIAILHNRYHYRGGEDNLVDFQVRLLTEAGHRVDTYIVNNDDVFRTGLSVKALAAAVAASWNTRAYKRVKQLLCQCRPNVCHVHNWFPLLSPSVYAACRELNVPVVQTLHNYRLLCANATLFRDGEICELCLDGELSHALKYRCYRGSRLQTRVWRHVIERNQARQVFQQMVDRYIAPSQIVADKHMMAGLNPEKMIILPHACDDPLARLDTEAIINRDLHASDGAVYVGRLSPEKSLHTLIESWREIDLPLKIIGDGPEEWRLHEMAASQDKIEFLGRLEHDRVIDQILGSAMLIFSTGCYDTFGLGIVEAMACGRPVIAHQRGGPAEIIEHEKTGLLVSPGSPCAMRQAVLRLAGDPALLNNCGQAARRRYLEKYSPAAYLRSIEHLYSELAGLDQS